MVLERHEALWGLIKSKPRLVSGASKWTTRELDMSTTEVLSTEYKIGLDDVEVFSSVDYYAQRHDLFIGEDINRQSDNKLKLIPAGFLNTLLGRQSKLIHRKTTPLEQAIWDNQFQVKAA